MCSGLQVPSYHYNILEEAEATQDDIVHYMWFGLKNKFTFDYDMCTFSIPFSNLTAKLKLSESLYEIMMQQLISITSNM